MKANGLYNKLYIIVIILCCANILDSLSCPDVYSLQTVSFDEFVSNKMEYVSGENVTFLVSFNNTKPIPIVDGRMRLQISIDEGEGLEQIVEDKVLEDSYYLQGGENKSAEISWNIPLNSKSGRYYAKLFFYSHGFQLAGVASFLDMPGGRTFFYVNSSREDYVQADLNSVELNGRKYDFLNSFANPVFTENDSIVMKFKLENKGRASQIKVEKRIYFWEDLKNSELEKFCILEDYYFCDETANLANLWESSGFEMNEGGTSEQEYNVGKLPAGVYNIIITISKGEQKSIIRTRSVVTGEKENALFAYAGVDKFPLKVGDQFNAFACFGIITSSGLGSKIGFGLENETPINGMVNFHIIFSDSEIEKNYSVQLTSDQNGIFMPIKVPEDSRNATFTATLIQDGRVLDRAAFQYDFENFERKVFMNSKITGIENGVNIEIYFRDSDNISYPLQCKMLVINSSNNIVYSNSYGESAIVQTLPLKPDNYVLSIICEKEISNDFHFTVLKKEVPPDQPLIPLSLQAVGFALIAVFVIVVYSLHRIKQNIDLEERLQKEEERMRSRLLRKWREF